MTMQLPVLQLWAPGVGWVHGTARLYQIKHTHDTRRLTVRSRPVHDDLIRLRDERRANGQAFKGERVKHREVDVTLATNATDVILTVLE